MARKSRNPRIFGGKDLIELGTMAAGLAATASLNEKFLWPVVKNVAPGTGMLSQIAHGAANLVTAGILGKLVSMAGQHRIGENLQLGGQVLGAGEIVLSPIPGATVTGSFPTSFPWRAPSAALAPTAAVPLLQPGTTPSAANSGGI